MSEVHRALQVKACEEYRLADVAREQAADCQMQGHVSAANATGAAVESDIGRLAGEIRALAGDREAREAHHNANAVHPYRYKDATHNHPPSSQYMSYY